MKNCKFVNVQECQQIENEGWQDCVEGKELEDNPYPQNSKNSDLWRQGWISAEGCCREGT